MMNTLRGGYNNGEAENIKESDSFSDVNIIPEPKNSAKKTRVSKRRKSNKSFPVKTYIYIDDDDIPSNHHDGTCIESDSNSNSVPVKLPNCKRTYPSGPSDECGDSKGILQKLWEKASLKKKSTDSKQIINETPTNNAIVQISVSNTDELSAKQRALKDEAERLLKRKEAEKLRLLDIEKRQKQRVEEVREIKKKENENMRLKEIYRTKVQDDLKKLEMASHDMPSLLGNLGIFVDNASFNQIRGAYKQALLTFHPDRVSRSDMYQQVEAEEKFKLISRMRDKFLSS
ncbi:hypothetical protein LXL04_011056 [Taraxacum kok-saghyz]